MADVTASTLVEFVLFCLGRRQVAWPSLYDEMCYVAGHRLFRGMGYEELRDLGLDFTLVGLPRVARLTQDVIAREAVEAAAN